jgi:hypothetical protein
VCVLFALIGAPLTIITIGDLGKFVSEFTIWLYKRLKILKSQAYMRYRRMCRKVRLLERNNIILMFVNDFRMDRERDLLSLISWSRQLNIVMIWMNWRS